jgi:hypothetical protein
MSLKFWVGLTAFIGSLIGGYIPALWGDSLLSYSSVLLSGLGGIIGVILGLKIGRLFER